MNKHLHDIDHYFKTALEEQKTIPSPWVWEKLDADLSKKEAKDFKKRYGNLKRIAAVLLLMFLSLLLYQVKQPSTKSSGIARNFLSIDSVSKENKKEEDQKITNRSFSNQVAEEKRKQKVSSNSFVPKTIQSSVPVKLNYATYKNEGEIAHSFSEGLQKNYEERKKNHSLVMPFNTILTNKNSTGLTATTISIASAHPLVQLYFFQQEKQLSGRTKNRKKDTWALHAFVSKDWWNYRLEDNSNSNVQNEDKVSVKRREKHEPSMSTGVFLSHRINRYFSLATGLVFSRSAILIEPQEVYAVKKPSGGIAYKLNLSSGYAYFSPFGASPLEGDSLLTSGAQHNLKYLSMPIAAQFQKQKKKIGFLIMGGLSLNKLLSATLKTEVNTSGQEMVSNSKLQGIKSMYLGFIANVGVEYKLSNQFSLKLSPSFRYALTPINKYGSVKTYPYNYGISAGASWRL